MKHKKGITEYSEEWPGDEGNYDWSVRCDITDGVVGITQAHNSEEHRKYPLTERVLLTKRQFEELVRFLRKK